MPVSTDLIVGRALKSLSNFENSFAFWTPKFERFVSNMEAVEAKRPSIIKFFRHQIVIKG